MTRMQIFAIHLEGWGHPDNVIVAPDANQAKSWARAYLAGAYKIDTSSIDLNTAIERVNNGAALMDATETWRRNLFLQQPELEALWDAYDEQLAKEVKL